MKVAEVSSSLKEYSCWRLSWRAVLVCRGRTEVLVDVWLSNVAFLLTTTPMEYAVYSNPKTEMKKVLASSLLPKMMRLLPLVLTLSPPEKLG